MAEPPQSSPDPAPDDATGVGASADTAADAPDVGSAEAAGDAAQPDGPEEAAPLAAPPPPEPRLKDRRVVERALDHGLLVAREAQTVLEAITRDALAGAPRPLAEVLREADVDEPRIEAIDIRALEGRVIGGFRLIEPIGIGGVGCVFLAEQLSLRRLVAVKVLDPALAELPQIVERFRREAHVAARLSHPHIVTPIDYGEDGELHYFAMEHLEGGSAAERLAALGPFAEREALRVTRSIAEALVYAEQEGVLHRDVKPDNIVFDRHDTPKLADLGLVLELQGSDPKLTARGMVMGSPHYMAPEQAQSQRAIDHRADIYALGVTLFELLAGHPPFTGPSATAILAAHVSRALPDLRQDAPEVSQGTWQLIQRMCAKDPADRPSAARNVVVAIDRLLDQSGERPGDARASGETLADEAATPEAPEVLGPPARRPGARVAFLAFLALLVLVVSALALGKLLGGLGEPVVDPEREARAVFDLKTLLLSRRGPDGGFGDDVGQPMDPWSSAEAILALSLLEDPALERDLASLIERFPDFALDGRLIGGAPGFAGYPYALEDNVATLEATASIGLMVAIARGRVPAPTDQLGRDIFFYLLDVQNSDGSWSTLPVLGGRGAMTSATAIGLIAVAALSRSLRQEARAWPAVARAARWLAAVYDREGDFFNVNPRRRWGDRRSIPGLNEECALALLETRALARRMGESEDALVRETLYHVAANLVPFPHEPDYEGITRTEDYTFRELDARFRATTADDRWVAYPFRILLAHRFAEEESTPRRAAWRHEALRLRARIPDLATLFQKRPPWQIAEALLPAAVLRHEGLAPSLAFVDLVR